MTTAEFGVIAETWSNSNEPLPMYIRSEEMGNLEISGVEVRFTKDGDDPYITLVVL